MLNNFGNVPRGLKNYLTHCSQTFWLAGGGVIRCDALGLLIDDTVTRSSDYKRVLDCQSELLDTNTTRDYTSQITTTTHRPVFSVTLLPTADVPLLPGRNSVFRPNSYQPTQLCLHWLMALIKPQHGPQRDTISGLDAAGTMCCALRP
jgi:hypothetical protein